MQDFLIFEAGEVRQFEYAVTSNKTADYVIITAATWQLRKPTGEVVTAGDCTVEGNTIKMLVELAAPGSYTLRVTADIPPETIIEDIALKVV